MAYTLSNLQTDIRNYTEVDSTVLTDAIVNTFIVNAFHLYIPNDIKMNKINFSANVENDDFFDFSIL